MDTAQGVTRATFEGFQPWQVGLYVLSTVSTAIFVVGCIRLLLRYRLSRKDGAAFSLRRMLRVVLTHVWIRRDAGVVGWSHAAVFYGFLVLFAGTTILAINEHITAPLGWDFWRGGFYLGYSLFLDVFGAAMLVGLVVLGVVRARRPARHEYGRADGRAPSAKRARYRLDDWVFYWSLLIIGSTGFLLESLRYALDQPAEGAWSPVGDAFGRLLNDMGVHAGGSAAPRLTVWWIHGIAALAFIAAIPFTKAMHMLTGPSAIGLRDAAVSQVLPTLPETGYTRLEDFAPRHRLDLDACTKCGKCDEVCPARAAGAPLSPRDLILDLREAQSLGVAGPLVPDVIQPATLWSCTQCNACVDICPVGIEHVPIINLLRRGLVEEGELDQSLQAAFEAVHTSGNSFGQPRRKRSRWVKDLDFEILDARSEAVDVVWYVGDYASFDPRNQRNTRALAELLHRAEVSVGILFEGERTAGNDIRRAGEEGLFQSLVAENLSTLAACDFQRIVTSDPHTFNTLRNEYVTLGAPWGREQVLHHSQLLQELLRSQRLTVSHPLNGRATYHDPCALGRYNGVFDPPRQVVEATGISLAEMPRNRSGSFCCGAGGGRIWMKDTSRRGSRRPSEQRIDEALALGPLDFFVVACPKDVTMYEDAIKTSGHEGDIELKEISELLLEATA